MNGVPEGWILLFNIVQLVLGMFGTQERVFSWAKSSESISVKSLSQSGATDMESNSCKMTLRVLDGLLFVCKKVSYLSQSFALTCTIFWPCSFVLSYL